MSAPRATIDSHNTIGEDEVTITKFTVCTDCYMTAAGYSEEELGYTPESEPLSQIDFQVIVPDHDGDAHCGKHPCEGCGTRYHGSRLEIAAWNHTE